MQIEDRDWSLTTSAQAEDLLESPPGGLDAAEVAERLSQFGTNEIIEAAGRTRLQILVAQFNAVLTYVLLGAALISLVLGDWIEAIAILAIVILNAVMGYVQESKAEEAMAALQKMAVPEITLRRGGAISVISSEGLVPATEFCSRPAISSQPMADSFSRRTSVSRKRPSRVNPRQSRKSPN